MQSSLEKWNFNPDLKEFTKSSEEHQLAIKNDRNAQETRHSDRNTRQKHQIHKDFRYWGYKIQNMDRLTMFQKIKSET